MKQKTRISSKIVGFMAIVSIMALMFGMTTFAATKQENIPAGKAVYNYDRDYSIVHYYKFTVKSPSLIVVSGNEFSSSGTAYSMRIGLCNSSGKELGYDYVDDSSDDAAGFAVNKGTYMFSVKSSYMYGLVYESETYAEKSGKSASKAVALKKGKTKKGVIGIGESKSKVDYYKITLKKDAKITMQMKIDYSYGGVQFKLSPSKELKKKLSGDYTKYLSAGKSSKFTIKSNKGALPAGTYYVKISRSSKYSDYNAAYQLKWVK